MNAAEFSSFYEIAIYLLIGTVMIIAFFVSSKKAKRLFIDGIHAEGVVFDLEISGSTIVKSQYPIIRFLTKNNEWITEPYNVGILPSIYKKGQKVDVIYNAASPKEFILKSDNKNKIVSILILLTGIACFSLGTYKLIQEVF